MHAPRPVAALTRAAAVFTVLIFLSLGEERVWGVHGCERGPGGEWNRTSSGRRADTGYEPLRPCAQQSRSLQEEQSAVDHQSTEYLSNRYWDEHTCGQPELMFTCPAASLQGRRAAGLTTKAEPARWAVIGLLMGGKSWRHYKKGVLRRDRSIITYLRHVQWPADRPIDFVYFHEGNMDARYASRIAAGIPSPHRALFMDVRTTGAFTRPRGEPDEELGYKMMCEFYTFLYVRLLCDYDFYWRMDDDNQLVNATGNILADFELGGHDYAYVHSLMEPHKPTKRTLPTFARRFLQSCGVRPWCGDRSVDQQNFYNNFHLSRVSRWLQPDVQHFFRHVYLSQGIFDHRWGDSTVQALAAKIFFPPDSIVNIRGVSYIHGSHKSIVRSSTLEERGSATWEKQQR